MNSRLSSEQIKAEANALGFSTCGVAKAEPVDSLNGDVFRRWLDSKGYADMDYMARNVDKRLDPRILMPGVKSIVCVALNYAPATRMPQGELQIAAYALGLDYHDIVKKRLHTLASRLGVTTYRAFCDTAPVLERYWAERTGLGWIGRHSLLVHPRWGSYCFIGVMISDFEPDTYSSPFEGDRCGTCGRCLAACPTKALTPGVVDANRCISYNTIERKDAVPLGLKPLMEGYLFGCDVCQDVCPWNRKAVPHRDAAFRPDDGLLNMTREDWLALDEAAFRERFARSPLSRPGLRHLQELLR